MSWITFIWSMTAGICLTLGALHFVIWTHRRDEWANLVFSMAAAAAAGYAVLDMVALRVHTPAEYGELWRWALLLGMLEGPLIVGFLCLYLRAGRPWLLWLICGLRALMLVLNFVPGPNFYFRELAGLQQTPLLGELISRPHGVLHPWVMLMPLSFVLIILFALDAAHTASKRSGRRRPWVLGGLLAAGFSLGLVSYALYARGILPTTFSSQLVLSLILVMGYELSLDVLRAGQLSADLRESEARMTLAAEAADFGVWMWTPVTEQVWGSEHWFRLFGFTPGGVTFEMVMQRIHPEDREPVERAVRRAMEDQADYIGEFRLSLPDGTQRWLSARARVYPNRDGKSARMMGATIDITERHRAEAAVRELGGRLINAQEHERRRIARDLHDGLSQTLALISVELEMFGQEAPAQPGSIAGRMQEFSGELKSLASEVHRLAHDLHPAKLDQLGLTAAVRGFCKELAVAQEIAIHFEPGDVPPELPDDVALCLYRITQEALQNVVKHSGATTAKVALAAHGRELHLVVADDGHGFDLQAIELGASLGIVGMRERVRMVHGQISVDSRPGDGTRVQVRVPLPAQSATSTARNAEQSKKRV